MWTRSKVLENPRRKDKLARLVDREVSILRKSARTCGSAGKAASPEPRGSISFACSDEQNGR
jgi:hypothetical protein